VNELPSTGSTEDSEEVCYFCGNSVALARSGVDRPTRTGICRSCLLRLTEEALDHISEWSGVPRGGLGAAQVSVADPSGEVEDVWDRFDSAMASRWLLEGIRRSIGVNLEQIDCTWGGGPAHESSARIDADVELVRSLLTNHGYEEVHVCCGSRRGASGRPEVRCLLSDTRYR
jgi:hypothetical protein